MQQLMDLASEMGFCLMEMAYYETEFSVSILKRLVQRGGKVESYQSAAYHLKGFARQAALSLLGTDPQYLVADRPALLNWNFGSLHAMRHALGALLEHTGDGVASAGLTKGLMTGSETVIRVMAMMIPPLEVAWMRGPSGLHRLYVNFQYSNNSFFRKRFVFDCSLVF